MDSGTKTLLESKYLSICRCCLKEDGSRDIYSVYSEPGDRELYQDLLNYTFNIQISPHRGTALICDGCYTRLQDARSFKQMVVRSEELFQHFINNFHYEEDIKLSETVLKLEVATDDTEYNSEVIFNQGDDSFDDDDELLSNIKQELNKTENEAIFKTKRKITTEKKYKSKRCKIKDDVIESNEQKDWAKISERRGTGPLLRQNSLKLIENSTICVFQWNKSRYRCFCCKEPFSDINLLKEHTNNTHTLQNIEKKIIVQQNRLVKVEISNIECKLCREKLESLPALKEHLTQTHGRVIGEDLLVPFRIENELRCQICLENFSQFRVLNIHMNKHFQRQVCHICGAGFSNLVFLNLHKTRTHRQMSCKTCNLTFEGRTDKKNHDVTVHGVKFERKFRFPCPYCPQRFLQENIKIIHLVESHGMKKPEFKCDICFKVFVTRSLCNNHVKNVHNKEKNQECDICHHYFYTKSDVTRHKVTHSGEKKYCCNVCNNHFASRDSLRRHLKRTHVVSKNAF